VEINYEVATASGLILAAVLIYILHGLRSGVVAEAQMNAEAGAAEPLDAESAMKRAQMLSGAGDYRAAVRYLYLAALLHLDEHGLLRYDRSLINCEYLRRVADRPDLAATLRDVVNLT